MHRDQASDASPTTSPTAGRAEHAPAPSPEYVVEIDHEGTILALSGPVAGFSAEEIVGTKMRRWVAPVAHAAFDRALAEVHATAEPRTFAWIALESGRHLESRITPMRRGGQVTHAVITIEDVTGRERHRQALRESEERFQALVLGAFEGLQVSIGATIQVANEALARMVRLSVEQMVGRNGFEFCAPESLDAALEHFRSGSEAPYEVVAVRADGTRFPCEVLGRNITYQGKQARLTGFRDLTERHRLERERKEIEEQMLQAQKLESLGVLAGGIAHDFNNVLMAVLANAEVALQMTASADDMASYLSDIRSAALRGRELTRQLLNYAAQGPLTMQAVDLNELVRDTVALIGVSISKKAELSLQLAAEPAVVEGDPGQLRQVIMNLVINASEALADQVGRIDVRIEATQVTPKDLEGSPLPPELPAGCAIMLRVADTGRGMPPAMQKRIFEPFFTTKVTGRGLGLASVLNIVRGHRGAIRVRSEEGRGTEFTLWLRCSERQPTKSAPPVVSKNVGASRGMVLVADDEPILRNLATEVLAGIGFEVVVAEDGISALQKIEEHRHELVMVLLDLTMPKLSGVEALKRMRDRGIDIPVLCTSGYSAELVASQLASDPRAAFLPKPYSLAELTSGIDSLLSRQDVPA